MKSKIEIELFEEHQTVNFYTLRFQDEVTEVDKFLDQFPDGCEYDEVSGKGNKKMRRIISILYA